MALLDYSKAVQAAGEAAGPAASTTVLTPVKQVRGGAVVHLSTTWWAWQQVRQCSIQLNPLCCCCDMYCVAA
jgi:hypothetical protein